MNNITQSSIISQVDYIKILLDESRYGDAFQKIKNLENNISDFCENLQLQDLTINDAYYNTKVGNSIYVDGINIWGTVTENTKESLTINLCNNKLIEIEKVKKQTKIKV